MNKKKSVSVLCVGMVSIMCVSANAGSINYGDIDGDGAVTATDAAYVMQYVLNKQSIALNSEQLARAGVSGGEDITATDAAQILQRALDSSYLFEVEKNTTSSFVIGQSKTTLPTPSRIDSSCGGCDEYIYNTDYTDYTKVSVKDGVVVEINTFSQDFDYLGNKYGDTGSVVGGGDGVTVTGYYDTLADNTLYGLCVKADGFSHSYSYSEGEIEMLRGQMLDIVNVYRVKYGRTPVEKSEGASLAAQKHCEDMVENKYYSDYDLNGKSERYRLNDEGIWCFVCGENIAYGYDGGIDVVVAWIASGVGRDEILYTTYKYVGSGVAYNAEDTTYDFTRCALVFYG